MGGGGGGSKTGYRVNTLLAVAVVDLCCTPTVEARPRAINALGEKLRQATTAYGTRAARTTTAEAPGHQNDGFAERPVAVAYSNPEN